MKIEKIAVIGAGVMGSGIAAQIANAGIEVDLLDIPADGDNRNAIAEAAIDRLLKTNPPALMHKKNVRLIRPGNTDDDFNRLAEVDWVIEAIIEDPAIKTALYQRLDTVLKPQAILSSNTSTLPLKILGRNMSESSRRRFLISHFFNPPRYMRLLELVTPTEMDAGLLSSLTDFADRKLGKGCVFCHDTPGFIANRIGTFWIQKAFHEAIALKLTVEQCDAVMQLFGVPKTGVFGLLDLVGLDLMPHILDSFRHNLAPDDPLHNMAEIPELLNTLISQGYTGRKGKGGFYRLQQQGRQKIKQAVDLNSGEYRISHKYRIEGAGHDPAGWREFLSRDDALGQYAWRVWSETLLYSARLVPEIADDIVAIDKAMRLGYNWRYGPFECLDRLGLDWFVDRLQTPRPLTALLQDKKRFYRIEHKQQQYKTVTGHYQPVPHPPGVLSLTLIKQSSEALLHNASASLWDLDDGIVCLEFHSKMNTLDPDNLSLIQQAIELVKQKFQGLVIYNEAEQFSAGANLALLGPSLQKQDWQAIEDILRLGQQSYHALKYAPFPVVGAPSGLALGGGCEILLHCDAIQAHAELYIGLVEVGVGLVPAWGGCKELLQRCLRATRRPGGPMPPIAQCFETIAMAKVSKSAAEAQDLLYLSATDGISMNRDRVLADAKQRTLSLCNNYQPPEPFEYALPGPSAWAALDIAVKNLSMAGKITEYDAVIARQLATVLSGGETDITQTLTEQDLFALERQAFLRLIKRPETLARLEHMLKTGKPLRN